MNAEAKTENKAASNSSYGEFFNKLKSGKPVAVCRRCGRLLTDEASVKVGIGPECAAKEAAGE